MQNQMNSGSLLDPLSTAPGMDPEARRWESGPLAALMFLGSLLVPAGLLFLFYRAHFQGLVNPDAMDFAQLGRNLSGGQGFVTYILRPLALTQGDNPLHQPDVTHGPLFPLFLALAFGAAGVRDNVVAAMSGLFYVLTCPVLFLLGSRVFNRPVGFLAALAFAFSAPALEFAISGLHITLYIFLTSTLLLITYNLALGAQNVEAAAAAGMWAPLPRLQLILAGLLSVGLYMTDPAFFPVIPVMAGAVLWFFRRQRVAALVMFLLPVLLVAGPWMFRNLKYTGNPIWGLRGQELWMHTESSPGFEMYRMPPGFLQRNVGLADDIARKVLGGLNRLVLAFPETTSAWVFGFFLTGMFFRSDDEPTNRLRAVLIWLMAGLLCGTIFFYLPMLHFTAFAPAMLVFGLAFVFFLFQQNQQGLASRLALYGFIAFLLAYPGIYRLVLGDKGRPVREAATARALENGMRKDELALSDEPWLVAWYGNRPGMWVPRSDAELIELRKRFKGLRWMMLTERSRGLSGDWRSIYDVFRRWNEMCVVARQTKKPTPAALQVQGRGQGQGQDRPLLVALQGFTTVAPVESTDPTTAVAVLPAPMRGQKAPRTP